MHDDPSSAIHPPERIPPFRALIAICARSSQGLTEWFRGEFDGQHWRARDLPSSPQEWFVSGWCEGEPRGRATPATAPDQGSFKAGPQLVSADA